MEIVPTPDGLITIAQAAALTNRSEKTIWAWTSKGYKAQDGKRVKVSVRRRDGWTILVDPVEIARADIATDPKRRFRGGFPARVAA